MPPGLEITARNASATRRRGVHPADVQSRDRAGAGCGVSAVPRRVDPAWLDDSVNLGASSSVRSLRSE